MVVTRVHTSIEGTVVVPWRRYLASTDPWRCLPYNAYNILTVARPLAYYLRWRTDRRAGAVGMTGSLPVTTPPATQALPPALPALLFPTRAPQLACRSPSRARGVCARAAHYARDMRGLALLCACWRAPYVAGAARVRHILFSPAGGRTSCLPHYLPLLWRALWRRGASHHISGGRKRVNMGTRQHQTDNGGATGRRANRPS